MRASLIEDVARLDDARQGLAELVGWGGMRLMRLDTKMPLPRPDPEDVDVWVQQGGHFPTVGVTGRHNYRKTEGTLFGGGSEVATTDLSVSLSLPLYRGGATSAAVRQAVKQHARAQEALQQRQREIERQVRAAFEGMRTARSRIEALREGVAAQQVVVEGRRRGERAGVYTQVAVAEAEQDLQAAVRDLTRARYDYLLESLRLKRAAGLLAVTDLETINAWLR